MPGQSHYIQNVNKTALKKVSSSPPVCPGQDFYIMTASAHWAAAAKHEQSEWQTD